MVGSAAIEPETSRRIARRSSSGALQQVTRVGWIDPSKADGHVATVEGVLECLTQRDLPVAGGVRGSVRFDAGQIRRNLDLQMSSLPWYLVHITRAIRRV